MATATNITASRDTSGLTGGTERELVIQFNALVVKFQLLLEKLDADAGVTDTDFASTLGANSSGEARRIGNRSGTAITA